MPGDSIPLRGFGLRSAPVGAKPRSTGPRAPRLSLGKDEHTLIFFYARGFDPAPRVRSPLRSGRRKAEVHRTSCAPSVALGYKNRKSI